MMSSHKEGMVRHPATLLLRFAEQVRRNPEALAVIDQHVRLSYAQLASASERIARGCWHKAQGAVIHLPCACRVAGSGWRQSWRP